MRPRGARKEAPSGDGQAVPVPVVPRTHVAARSRGRTGDGRVCADPGAGLGRRSRHPADARWARLVDLQRDQQRSVEARNDIRAPEGACRGNPRSSPRPRELSGPPTYPIWYGSWKPNERRRNMRRVKLIPTRMYLAPPSLPDGEEGQAMVEYALILALVSVA